MVDTTPLKQVLNNLQHTNVIVLGLPLTTHAHINEFVIENNNNLKEACKMFPEACIYVDINAIISLFRDIVFHSMLLSYDKILPKVKDYIEQCIDTLHNHNILTL